MDDSFAKKYDILRHPQMHYLSRLHTPVGILHQHRGQDPLIKQSLRNLHLILHIPVDQILHHDPMWLHRGQQLFQCRRIVHLKLNRTQWRAMIHAGVIQAVVQYGLPILNDEPGNIGPHQAAECIGPNLFRGIVMKLMRGGGGGVCQCLFGERFFGMEQGGGQSIGQESLADLIASVVKHGHGLLAYPHDALFGLFLEFFLTLQGLLPCLRFHHCLLVQFFVIMFTALLHAGLFVCLCHLLQPLWQIAPTTVAAILACVVIQLMHRAHITQKVTWQPLPQTNALITRCRILQCLGHEHLQKIGPTPILHGAHREMQRMIVLDPRQLGHVLRPSHRLGLMNPPPRQIQHVPRPEHHIHQCPLAHLLLHLLLGIISRTLTGQRLPFVQWSVHPPPFVSLELQYEDVDVVVVRREALGVQRSEIRVGTDHASEFALEQAEHGMDVVTVRVRPEETEGTVRCVNVGPYILGIGNNVLQIIVVLVIIVRRCCILLLGSFALLGRWIQCDPVPQSVAHGIGVLRNVQIQSVA
mmetsp:Transcript_43430/g.74121  ORF Transcript_43430/g.74121 Transcript_43430/m.74121 type:complete len:526 (-) Transcript_43430:154-1731(-)